MAGTSRAGERFPADKAVNVNPDTHLELTFSSAPILGDSGQIRIYDAANNRLVVSQPQPVTAKLGERVTLQVHAAAVPEPSFQWLKNGRKLLGATGSALILEKVGAGDAAEYSVVVGNESGTSVSNKAIVLVR